MRTAKLIVCWIALAIVGYLAVIGGAVLGWGLIEVNAAAMLGGGFNLAVYTAGIILLNRWRKSL